MMTNPLRELGTEKFSVRAGNLHHAIQVIVEQVCLRLRFAPCCLPISPIESDGINDEQNGNRGRYGEQRSHVQKSTFND
jgi:hypothetical protein